MKILVGLVLFVAVACSVVQTQQKTNSFSSTADSLPVNSPVLTADIQAGIEKHIEEKTRADGGHFVVSTDDGPLKLKLVRVHTEYLANLGPGYHFACVDMACPEGNFYDVDFFLSGEPGSMKVTETTVHKYNGEPLYVWEQAQDKTWHRHPVEGAAPELLGVIKERDIFEFRYRVSLPELNAPSRMWLPLPRTDDFQNVEIIAIHAPSEHRILDETTHGNKLLFFELKPEHSGEIVEIQLNVQRLEKSAYATPAEDSLKYLKPENKVPLNNEFRQIAQKVVAGKQNDLVRARALYDHVIDRMRYIKVGKGWGQGDAVYACDVGTGNCTDYHAYFIGLARAAGIPARFAIGASIPSARDEGGTDGYHCWAEFYAEGKWWPVDISEADKCSALATYFFGRHPANRLEFTRGRDLVVDPSPTTGPINFLAYPILEIGGKPVKAKVQFLFNRSGTAG